MTHKKQRLAILGSTGSIGTQTLDIVRRYGDLFEVTTLTARSRWEALVAQAIEFSPDNVVIADETYYPAVRDALADRPVKVYAGNDALEQVVRSEQVDTVVMALVGYSGLFPTASALRCGKKVALANKECLVVAGELITELSERHRAPIIPVDSEHSAIFQCLSGERSEVEKVILTASGGPFLNRSADELRHVTVAEALAHPSWCMGAKVTIDSASLMNKGFEVIEAVHLFDVQVEQIEVAIHRESIIHSAVEYNDNAVIAQLSVPDMKLCAQYALTCPERLPGPVKRLELADIGKMTFYKPDFEAFPLLALAIDCIKRGGVLPAALNAADEVAVSQFLDGYISFTDIMDVVDKTISKICNIYEPDLPQLKEASAAAMLQAAALCKSLRHR